MSKPFGEDLWKNAQAVRFAKDGGLEVPVRADGEHGIRIGLDAVAASPQDPPTPRPRRRLRDLLRRRRP